jgi:GNAT superfamily N-acetyltransferase
MQPDRIDVDRARREAKALLASARGGDPTAMAQLRDDRPPALADAQRAIARRHGYRSWQGLLAVNDVGRQLRAAARRGDEDEVYALLLAGADPNAVSRRSGHTALHVAAAADALDSVSVLVGWVPADKNRRDVRGRTPLDLARRGSPIAAVLAQFRPDAGRAELRGDHAALAHAATIAFADHRSRGSGVERWTVGDGFAFRSDLHDNTSNGVVADRADASQIAQALDRLASVPAMWLLPTGQDHTDLGRALERAGFCPDRDSTHMHADLTTANVARDPGVREVDDPAALVGVDAAEAGLLLASGHPLRAFAIDDAACVVTFTAGTTLLGVHLKVARGHRRRGLGRTLARHAGAVARDAGCTDAIVSQTAATIPFYERLGLTLERSLGDVGYFLPYDPRPANQLP